MYGALWRLLPGPTWARVTMLVAGAVIVITLLMMFAFPAIDDLISRTDPAVGQ
jgi:hypothetical protein